MALAAVGAYLLGQGSRPGGNLRGLALLETQTSDYYFHARDRLWPHSVPLDPRVVMLTLDDDAMGELGKPELFWDADLARVTQKLLEAGALGVGLDFVRNPPLRKVTEEVRTAVTDSQDELVEPLASDRLLLIELGARDSRRTRAWPSRLIAAAAGGRNSCVANLVTDPDGVVRRIPVATQQPGQINTFALRLAELTTASEMKEAAGRWTMGGQTLPDEDDCLRVNYPGPPGTIPSRPLARLLRDGDYSAFRGKVVLLIPDLGNDLLPTPYMTSTNRLSLGGEIQASALNTVLTGRYLRSGSEAWWCGPCILLAVVVCLSFALIPPFWAVVVLLACCLGDVTLGLWMFSRGVVLPLCAPLFSCGLGLILGLLARYLGSEAARMRVQRILGRMVSPQVASAVLRGSDLPPLGGQRREITVLFSDINQFTPTCEKLEPEQVIEMLNAYFAEMVRLIHAHGGYVKQFVGDEIMAIFGAPDPLPEHGPQAVRCAIAMMERLEELARRDPTGQRGFYSVKIGINTGSAVCGQVGSLERSEYAAVGDDVNLAARLESLTTKLGVSNLVSPRSKDLAGPLPVGWEWKSMGQQSFKGKTVEMEVWTLVR